MPDALRHGIAPILASIALAGLVVTFAHELGAFRSAVEVWAERDLVSKTQLAAANLRETLRTGDFKSLYAFAGNCRREGLEFTVFSPAGGLFYSSSPMTQAKSKSESGETVYATAPSGEFSVRLGLPRERVLRPFRHARLGFALAALAGGAGMLLVFLVSYRQHVRIMELKRLERFRHEFITDVSHELKTPLTGILGAAEMLTDGGNGLPPAQAKLAEMIGREAKRLNTLAQGILDLARLEREGEVLRKTPTDLSELAADTVGSLAPRAKDAGMELSLRAQSGVTADCDAQLVSQALSNLIVNAIRHSQSKDIAVWLGGTARSITIAVEDHGVGIPADEAKRVFDRFHRVDPARSAETGGAGLGLAIVRRICRLHGGDVKLEGALPHGCRFVMTIPGRT